MFNISVISKRPRDLNLNKKHILNMIQKKYQISNDSYLHKKLLIIYFSKRTRTLYDVRIPGYIFWLDLI